MPRTRYTKVVRIRERRQIESRRRKLAALARTLHHTQTAPVAEPALHPVKERRRARREQNLLRKPKRLIDGADRTRPMNTSRTACPGRC